MKRLPQSPDTGTNWDSPTDPGPWREPECQRFNAATRKAISRLRVELGPDWHIDVHLTEIHEDTDLDQYLANPTEFQRPR